MIQYKEVYFEMGTSTVTNIQATFDDGSVLMIPLDPANSDYQAYLNRDNPDAEITQPTL